MNRKYYYISLSSSTIPARGGCGPRARVWGTSWERIDGISPRPNWPVSSLFRDLRWPWPLPPLSSPSARRPEAGEPGRSRRGPSRRGEGHSIFCTEQSAVRPGTGGIPAVGAVILCVPLHSCRGARPRPAPCRPRHPGPTVLSGPAVVCSGNRGVTPSAGSCLVAFSIRGQRAAE
jgi:hypothetical protein